MQHKTITITVGNLSPLFFHQWLTHISQQEQLKQREQSLRKQEQEMDSLSFRNQQLAKRVELLQEELAVSEAKGKKGKVIMKVDRGRGCSWGRVVRCALCFCSVE